MESHQELSITKLRNHRQGSETSKPHNGWKLQSKTGSTNKLILLGVSVPLICSTTFWNKVHRNRRVSLSEPNHGSVGSRPRTPPLVWGTFHTWCFYLGLNWKVWWLVDRCRPGWTFKSSFHRLSWISFNSCRFLPSASAPVVWFPPRCLGGGFVHSCSDGHGSGGDVSLDEWLCISDREAFRWKRPCTCLQQLDAWMGRAWLRGGGGGGFHSLSMFPVIHSESGANVLLLGSLKV